MRIHSSKIQHADVERAAATASQIGHGKVYVEKFVKHGSRSHGAAYDVTLTGDGTVNKRRVNYGTAKYLDRFDRPYAATWHSWGVFLAALYDVDPELKNPYYADVEDFHRKTQYQFTEV